MKHCISTYHLAPIRATTPEDPSASTSTPKATATHQQAAHVVPARSNGRLMSRPSSADRSSSPYPLVRSLSESFAAPPRHVSSSAPQTLSQEITPSDPPLRIAARGPPSDHFTYKIPIASDAAQPFHDRVAQLSERESTFATHCRQSETTHATTPNVRPTNYTHRSSHDLQDVPSNLEYTEPLPQASSSALLPRPPGSSASITSPQETAQSYQRTFRSHANSLHVNAGNTLQESSIHLHVNLHYPSRRGGNFVAGNTPVSQHTFTRSTKTSVPQLSRVNTQPILPSLRMSETQERNESSNRDRIANDEGTGSKSGRLPGERRRRSSSRDHVEKRIEATLANEDIVTNPRSRKASHYFGLFKENTSSQDTKKKETVKDGLSKKTKIDVGKDDRLPGGVTEVLQSEGATTDDDSILGRKGQTVQADASTNPQPGKKVFTDHDDAPRKSLSRVSSKGKLPRLPSATTFNSATFDDEHLSQAPDDMQAIEWRTRPLPGQGLPLRLLQDIRSYQGAKTSPRSLDKPKQRSSLEGEPQDKCNEFQTESDENDLTPTTSDNDAHSGKETSADDDFEADEHISSAMYFPHQALESSDPSLDESEILTHDDHDDNRDKPLKRSKTLEIVHEETHDSPDDEVQIALLQSQHKKQTFHGDLPPLPADTTISETLAANLDAFTSSASESEYESYDEVGQSGRGEETEDGDLTPTAEQEPEHAVHRRRRRPVPLGAVELKPYKHQVGGHSTVFRFSKRAVCKQLTNRENVFYEVIERVHPELLKFLPK